MRQLLWKLELIEVESRFFIACLVLCFLQWKFRCPTTICEVFQHKEFIPLQTADQAEKRHAEFLTNLKLNVGKRVTF